MFSKFDDNLDQITMLPFKAKLLYHNKNVYSNTLQKRKARENETFEQHETRIAKQRERTKQKRAREDPEEREACLARDRKRKRVKLAMKTK